MDMAITRAAGEISQEAYKLAGDASLFLNRLVKKDCGHGKHLNYTGEA